MSGDCPHHHKQQQQQLEQQLRVCHEQNALMTIARNNYISIIDELKKDLEELTLEVHNQTLPCMEITEITETQTQSPQQQTSLELVLQALEAHNERLQQALVQQCAATTAAAAKIVTPPNLALLENHNKQLNCQIKSLSEALQDRESHITQLNATIKAYTETTAEQRAQQEELIALKTKNCEQLHTIRELTSQIKIKEDERIEMSTKVQKLETDYKQLCGQIKDLSCQLKTYEEQGNKLQALTNERNVLRDEMIQLKNKEACMLGREKSLISQLECKEQQVCKAQRVSNDFKHMLNEANVLNEQKIHKYKCMVAELRAKYDHITKDYRDLQLRQKHQEDLNAQKTEILESYHKWKTQQIQADEAARKHRERNEEHIMALIEQNERLRLELINTQRDYEIFQNEHERNRNCFNTPRSGGHSQPPNDAMTHRTQRLYETQHRMTAMRQQVQTTGFMQHPENSTRMCGGNNVPRSPTNTQNE